MKKYLVKFYSMAVTVAMVMGLCCPAAFAAIPNENITATFEMGAVSTGNCTNALNQYDTSATMTGSVAPITLENDIFDKAYAYGWTGGSSGNNYMWKTYMEIPVNVPEHDSADAIYVSFYYKSKPSFTFNGTTYTCGESNAMNHIRDNKGTLLNLNTQVDGGFTFTADDEWHKVEAYVAADGRFSTNKLVFYNVYNLTVPMYFLIADVKVGVVHSNGDAYNNDKAYTEMGWFLKELGEVSALSVNGQALDLSGGQKEFTVKTADFSAPSIEMTGSDYIVNKVDSDTYEVTSVAYAYNKAAADTATVTYRQRGYDNGSGVWIYNSGNISNIETTNGTLKGETYTINLEYDEGFYVDGVKVDGTAVPTGKVYSYKKSFAKPENGTLTALIAAYDKETNQLVDVSLQNYTFAENETAVHISVDTNKDNSDDSLYFKVFMLDSLKTLQPLMPAKSTASITVE